jgi:hypothetical protein
MILTRELKNTGKRKYFFSHKYIELQMKQFLTLAILMLLVFSVYSCSDTTPIPESNGKVTEYSECKFQDGVKSEDTPDTVSCIEFYYDDDIDLLILRHINAGFNCCPGEITCKVTREGNYITIEEFQQESGCKCNCLYDVDIDIYDIEYGTYTIEFIEPLIGDAKPIKFEIDLHDSWPNEYCVTRTNYPWGMSLIE